ncbi:MAG TPA: hypothetical protein PLH94_12835 [Fimbriimonadaceae bacterium]|nr:hypothetical protein [Fimbriimonadaceae bacterium]
MPSQLEPKDDSTDRTRAHVLWERDPVRERDLSLDRAWQSACRHRESGDTDKNTAESADH